MSEETLLDINLLYPYIASSQSPASWSPGLWASTVPGSYGSSVLSRPLAPLPFLVMSNQNATAITPSSEHRNHNRHSEQSCCEQHDCNRLSERSIFHRIYIYICSHSSTLYWN